MAIKSLGDFTTPTGTRGNVFSIESWGSMILGTVVLIVTFSMGQHFADKLQNKMPRADLTPEQPWKSPAPVSAAKQKITL